MLRYVPRLVPAGSAPADALLEPLIADPPKSPMGEHELIPQVAWMVERDGAFVHVPASERGSLEEMRGMAMITMLDGELSNESLDQLPGVNLATNGAYAAELLLDADHLAALHTILGGRVYLAAAPRRGRFLVGGVGAGVDGMRAFVAHVKREHDAAPAAERISPVTLLVRDAAPAAIVGELQLAALAQAATEGR
ncbi:MAG: hypothetical protein JO257_03550 [Deltaproteobacteria bacterium]|nr:hypothetical protein [Deltaproteobacteria bacterium]